MRVVAYCFYGPKALKSLRSALDEILDAFVRLRCQTVLSLPAQSHTVDAASYSIAPASYSHLIIRALRPVVAGLIILLAVQDTKNS